MWEARGACEIDISKEEVRLFKSFFFFCREYFLRLKNQRYYESERFTLSNKLMLRLRRVNKWDVGRKHAFMPPSGSTNDVLYTEEDNVLHQIQHRPHLQRWRSCDFLFQVEDPLR